MKAKNVPTAKAAPDGARDVWIWTAIDVRNFTVDGSLISSRGMGERQLLDKGNPEGAINRRVEIRNVTRASTRGQVDPAQNGWA